MITDLISSASSAQIQSARPVTKSTTIHPTQEDMNTPNETTTEHSAEIMAPTALESQARAEYDIAIAPSAEPLTPPFAASPAELSPEDLLRIENERLKTGEG
jgi:hypothetical protein